MSASLSAGRGSGSSAWPTMLRPSSDHCIEYCDSISNHDKSSAAAAIRSVPAVMNYVSSETTEISARRDVGGSDSTLIGAIWEPTVIRVANARLGKRGDTENKLTLDRNGFELVSKTDQDPAVKMIKQLDFLDQDQIIKNYYPVCEQIVSDAIQSQKAADSSPPIAAVFAFDHNVSGSTVKSASESKGTTTAPQIQNPAGIVHADYTRTSAPKRLDDLSKPPKLNDVLRDKLLAENRNSLLDPQMVQEALGGKRRFAFVNVWRNLDAENPVKDCPLACVDASTSTMRDLRVFKIHYVDRVGENYFVCPSSTKSGHNNQHDWYYYPEMTMSEALLLKQWDSLGGIAHGSEADDEDDSRPSTFTIHSALIDPSCPPNAPTRVSIEVRCVVVWETD
eukprot:CCRYP_010523-RA/>CCRYP_010523-RA protein AED:0.06 eAED:0.09 QI:0/0/0/1/1/1/2/0/392